MFLPLMMLRFTLWSLLHALFRVRVIGADRLPKNSGALIVSNHVSYADAVLIGSATPRWIHFLLWKPIYESAFKPFFIVLKSIPISPTSPKESLAALAKARKELEGGDLIGIFPEGQITRTGHLLPFKRGFERIVEQKGATELHAPLIPIWLEGLWGHPLSMKGGKLFASWRNVWRPPITVMIGEPIHQKIAPEDLHARLSHLATHSARLRDSGTLGARFIRVARKHWSKLALADSNKQEFAFGRALTAALLLRGWLKREAAGQSTIGILLPNSSVAAIANLAVTLAGRTAVNLNFSAGEGAMTAAIDQCQIRTILTARKFLEKAYLDGRPGMVYLEDLLPNFGTIAKLTAFVAARLLPARWIVDTKQDDVAAVIFSSGSTGDPKGIELTHANVIANIEGSAQIYNVGHRDAMLAVLPFFHSFGFTYSLWFPLLNEFKLLLHANPTDAKTIGELAEKYNASFLLSTPTFCTTYLRKCTREQLGRLRYVIVGAEKLRASLAEEFKEKFGVTIFEGYGCTELGPVVAVNGPDFDHFPKQEGNRLGSVGRPLPGVSVRIVDPDTLAPRPIGEEGLLLVDSPSLMRGYLGKPRHEGLYNTGDIARLDEDGFLYITDRLSRFSKIGGEMVPHLKVEQALHSLTGDASVLVIGIPDDSRGERLVLLHTASHLEPGPIVEHLQELPSLWIPKRHDIFVVDAIPTLGTGKTDLRRARELALALAKPANMSQL